MLKKGTVYLLNIILFIAMGGIVFYKHFNMLDAVVFLVLVVLSIRGIGKNYIETWTNFFLKFRRTFLYLSIFIAFAGYNVLSFEIYKLFLGILIVIISLSNYLYVKFYNEDVEKMISTDNGVDKLNENTKKDYWGEISLYLCGVYMWFMTVFKLNSVISTETNSYSWKHEFFLIDMVLFANLINTILKKEKDRKEIIKLIVLIIFFNFARFALYIYQ